MDTRFLESLMAVAERGSIVAAARAQALTPAAISQRIQVLEQEIGAALLLRRPNAAEPTRLCRDLLPQFREIVRLSHTVRRHADPTGTEGVVRLGAISTMLTGLLPQALPRLRQIAPGLVPQVEPGSSATLYDALQAQQLDAALIVAPPFAPAASLTFTLLRTEPLCLLAPPALSGLPPEEVFRRLPIIAYDPDSWGGKLAQAYLDDHQLSPERFCALDGLEAISELVASGLGASLVPRWPGLRAGQMLPDGARYQRRIVLATPAFPTRPRVIAALRASFDVDVPETA
jgi:DNA-binding transcriptional LysR family regulator